MTKKSFIHRVTRFIFSRGTSSLVTLLICLSGPGSAALVSGAEVGSDIVNYAYLTDFGVGGFDVEDQQARALNIPLSYQLRPMEEDQWGIKLLFPVTVASVEEDVNYEGIPFFLDSKIAAVKPGIEVQIPLRSNWAIKPFGNVGLGRDLSEGRGAFLGRLGVKSRYSFPWRKFQFALGAGVFLNAYKPKDQDRRDFTSIGVGLDAVYPLWFKVKDRRTNIGGYVAYYYYIDDLEFERYRRGPIEIDDQIEVAATFGVYSPVRIVWWDFKRVGVAYRFGDGLKAIRLIASFPF